MFSLNFRDACNYKEKWQHLYFLEYKPSPVFLKILSAVSLYNVHCVHADFTRCSFNYGYNKCTCYCNYT